jgi:hypothetical protein
MTKSIRAWIEADQAFLRLVAAIEAAKEIREAGVALPSSVSDELIDAASAYLSADLRHADAEDA